jgi:hypothetical protein
MVIDSYSFGRIVVDGKEYTRDVIIDPEGTVVSWWRREGHKVSSEDLEELLKGKPEVLIFGTGYSGVMRVPKELIERLKKSGVEVIVQGTRDACDTYNRLCRSRKAWAALHLTC